MPIIVQPDVTNKDTMKFLYEYTKASCESYLELDYAIFHECRNSMYIQVKNSKHTFNPSTSISGIVGCRRITFSSQKAPRISYFSTPNRSIYSLEFVHAEDSSTNNLYKLISTCVADKNDSFVIYVSYADECQRYPTEHDALVKAGFRMDTFNVADGKCVYIKHPTVSS